MATYSFPNTKLQSLLVRYESIEDMPEELAQAFNFTCNSVIGKKDKNSNEFYFQLLRSTKALSKEYISLTLKQDAFKDIKMDSKQLHYAYRASKEIGYDFLQIMKLFIQKYPSMFSDIEEEEE